MLLALDPPQVFFPDKHDGARTDLAAPRAMTGAHHRRLAQQLEFDCPTATTSIDHQAVSLARNANLERTIREQTRFHNTIGGTCRSVDKSRRKISANI
jgi:hypothetical protein